MMPTYSANSVMPSFLDTINYSAANEDAGSECRALRLEPSDTVLCITGSGARPLSLLTERPGRVVAVDMNPCQNHLLRLKVAAFQHLDYDAILAFLGLTPSSQRVATYRRLRTNLPSASRTFWDRREGTVTEGVLYAGRWERHFRLLAQTVGWARPRLRRRLFDCRTMDEQAIVWDRWSRGAWSPFLRVATTRLGWRHVLRDPAFYEHVPPDFSIGAYVTESLNRAAGSFLFRDSAFATLLFFGRYCADGPLPLYLQREHYDTVRAGLDSLRIVDGSLTDALADAETPYSAFSLSDVGSYCDDAQYRQLWAGILRSAAPGARVCERQFLVKRAPVLDPPDVLRRDPEIEATLTHEDQSIFYTFVVGHLNGQSHA